LNVLTQDKYFGNILYHHPAEDALDIYLGSPVIPTHVEPLEYWTSINPQKNPLAQMACDFLSAPGMCSIDYSIAKYLHNILTSSTDVEHFFSQGRLNVSHLQHSLSDKSTRAATVFGSWVGIEGLVVTEDLIDNIQRKLFRGSKDGSAHRNIGGDLELDMMKMNHQRLNSCCYIGHVFIISYL
jgi:hypothetical protein